MVSLRGLGFAIFVGGMAWFAVLLIFATVVTVMAGHATPSGANFFALSKMGLPVAGLGVIVIVAGWLLGR